MAHKATGIGHVLSADHYGTSTIIGYESTEGGATYRVVEFIPAPGIRMHREHSRQWCAGADDVSPCVGYGQRVGYNPDCGWCWLGYGHSERAHTGKIGEVTP